MTETNQIGDQRQTWHHPKKLQEIGGLAGTIAC